LKSQEGPKGREPRKTEKTRNRESKHTSSLRDTPLKRRIFHITRCAIVCCALFEEFRKAKRDSESPKSEKDQGDEKARKAKRTRVLNLFVSDSEVLYMTNPVSF